MRNNHKTRLLENTLFLSVVFSVALHLLFFIFVNPRFETNDDVSLMMFASGFYTGQPSEYLIFTNVILGKLLNIFYSKISDFNWYTAYLYLTHFISTTLLLYSILYPKFNLQKILLFFLLFVFFESYLLLNLQYTSTAFVAGQSGVFLSISFLNNKDKSSWFAILTGIFLLVLTGLIREEVLYLILLLSTPLIGFKFFETKSIKLIALLGITLILSFASHQYNRAYYNDDEGWRQFFEYHFIQYQLHGNPRMVYSEATKPIFDKVKWSQSDFNMFTNWFYEDSKIYSQENLETISSSFIFIHEKTFSDALKSLFFILYDFKLLVLSTFCLVILTLFPFSPNNYKRYIYITTFLSIIIFIYLSYSVRLPPRVLVPILFFIGTISIFFITQEFNKFEKNIFLEYLKPGFIRIFVSMILISLLILSLLSLSRESRKNQTLHTEFDRLMKKISFHRDNLFVIWGGSFPVENINPYSSLKEYKGFNILWLGLETKTPFNHQIKERFSISNLYISLYERDNIFLICNEEHKELLKNYIEEHYNQHIEFKPIYDKLPLNTNIYKISKV